MKKITFSELCENMATHNRENGDFSNPIYGVVVYKKSNWEKEYSLKERSYRVSSRNRAFQDGKIANSIFAECLDGVDVGVRLDWYNWDVDYCYMEQEKN